jgi:hypothetical protein
MSRLLILLAVLCGLTWDCLAGRALFLPETRDMAPILRAFPRRVSQPAGLTRQEKLSLAEAARDREQRAHAR